jgi:DNA-binding protein YbaB
MKITINKTEMVKINGLVKTIFEKVVADLGLTAGIEAGAFDVIVDMFNQEGPVDTGTAIVTVSVTGEELTVEIKEEFLDNYLELMNDIATDVLAFAVTHKEILMLGARKAVNSIVGKMRAVVMSTMYKYFLPIMEPGKALMVTVQGRFEKFVEKCL